jgi:hypothetical protein
MMFKRKYKRTEWMEGLLQAEKMWSAGYTIHRYVAMNDKETAITFIDDDDQTTTFFGTREYATGFSDYTGHYYRLSKL